MGNRRARYKNVYQFKIVLDLDDVLPSVWRTIQVPQTYSFWDLHVAIQDAMGWQDSHLHAFRIKAPDRGEMDSIGIPVEGDSSDGPDVLAGWEVAIADYFAQPGGSAHYEYDFGDGWQHRVVLEEILPRTARVKYPRCLAGERACPPEDCGGPLGYRTLLEILGDPRHEDHDDTLGWVGGPFDAEGFDPKAVRFDNPGKRWESAFATEPEPDASPSALQELLDGPCRPAGAMAYREALGFLFAVACAPDMVPPSGWIPQIFGGEPDFESKREANEVFGELIRIHNDTCQGVSDGRVELPDCCWFYEDIDANYADDAPMRQWSHGFLQGHLWLDESWETKVTDAERPEYLLAVTALAFFSSRQMGEGLLDKGTGPKRTLAELAEMMREGFAPAMDNYARLGQSLHLAQLKRRTGPTRRQSRTVRNELCPCGSGKKFKQCCIGDRPEVTH